MASISIKNLSDKDQIQDRIFLVKDKVLGIGKTGKSFLTVLIGDQSGQIDGRIWDNIEENQSVFEIGDLVKIKGIVQVYNQRKQIIIHKIEKIIDESINKDDYRIKEKRVDSHALFSEVCKIVQTIETSYIKQLIEDCLFDDDIKNRVLNAPAAKSIHHAHRGGLIEHILSICQIMNFMASHYRFLNRDLLLFGAIFHDLGKIYELDINDNQQNFYTHSGQLLGHMLLSCELIEKKSNRILGFPDDLKILLKHIVLSHHGKIEYGSPKVPMFPEAMVIAMVDDFDSKVDSMMSFIQNERLTGDTWSRFNEHYQRFFLLEDLKKKWRE